MESYLIGSKIKSRSSRFTKISSAILEAAQEEPTTQKRKNVFLSHKVEDQDLIIKLGEMLEAYGLSVYIDWRDDQELDRSNVGKATAIRLRSRMKACDCLLYVATENARASKWMPWELGFKDGHDGHVAVLNVAEKDGKFQNQEYISMYPKVHFDISQIGYNIANIYIDDGSGKPFSIKQWVASRIDPTVEKYLRK